MATTTLKDYGRMSEEYGNIPYYYAFKYRFYFNQHQIEPDDVATWCKLNCEGYYKIVGYTHISSVRLPNSNKFSTRIAYVDKVYLSEDVDAVCVRLSYDVSDIIVRRPEKITRQRNT